MKPLRRRESPDSAPEPKRQLPPGLAALTQADEQTLRLHMIVQHAELQAAEFFRDLTRTPLEILWESHGFLDVLFSKAKERAENRVQEGFGLQGTEVTTFRRIFHTVLLRGIPQLMRRHPSLQRILEGVHTYTLTLGKQFADYITPSRQKDLMGQAVAFRNTLPEKTSPKLYDERPSAEDILYSYKRHVSAEFLYTDTRAFMATYLGDLGAASDAFVALYPHFGDDERIFEHVDPFFERLCILASHTRSQIHRLIREGNIPLTSLSKTLPTTLAAIYDARKKVLEAQDGASRLVPSVDLQNMSDKDVRNILMQHFQKRAADILHFIPPTE